MLRILIRDSSTKRYRRDGGEWTDDPKQALLFNSASAAVRYCEQVGCDPYEIVLAADGARYEMVIFYSTSSKC